MATTGKAPYVFEVTQDGAALPLPLPNEVKIAPTAQRLIVRFSLLPSTERSPSGRKQYKLEGFDPSWTEYPAEMAFTVYFYNHAGRRFEQNLYRVYGRSAGWTGSVDGSTFIHRKETITVPKGADSMMLSIASAGPPSTEGIYVVKGVVVTRTPRQGAPETLLDSASFLEQGGNPLAKPRWVPDGTKSSMASLIRLRPAGADSYGFCLIDDDPNAHAEWHTSKEDSAKVFPGERLTVEWDEIYSNGQSDQGAIHYDFLPPGRYNFRVQQLDVLGNPLPVEGSLALIIPTPIWKNPWIWALCALAVAALLFLAARWWIHEKFHRQLENIRLVEQERHRFARDLHDHLGARLTQISLMGSHVEDTKSLEVALTKLNDISGITQELITSLSEVVWTVNPENDHLESLVSFLYELIYNLCQSTPIRCRVDASGRTDERLVPSEIRHNLSLAVKEAVTNVLKHSGTTELRALIRFDEPLLKVVISDDGCGFTHPAPKGNGLANMKQRMTAMKGKLAIESVPGQGTTISFEVPIPLRAR